MTRPFPLRTGVATVTAVRSVTPRMKRLSLTAAAFADPGVEQPGEILTLGWPLGDEELVMPDLGWRFPAGRPEQHWRNFTVRAFDPVRRSIDVDFFLHGDLGHAARWAARAAVGDEVGFAGPRVHWEPDPAAAWSLLAADETGLPALLAILETLPHSHRAIAVAEIQADDERQPVASEADVDVHWVSRDGRAPGTTNVLVDALRAIPLPEHRGQAWAAGEALAIRDLRNHLRANCPHAACSMDALGYWKHRTTPDDVDE